MFFGCNKKDYLIFGAEDILFCPDVAMYDKKEYTATCIHSIVYSKITSSSVAPMQFIATKPFIAGVEGNTYENIFQKRGMLLPGHDIPERKSKGIDVKTNSSMGTSRLLMKQPAVIARNVQASI